MPKTRQWRVSWSTLVPLFLSKLLALFHQKLVLRGSNSLSYVKKCVFTPINSFKCLLIDSLYHKYTFFFLSPLAKFNKWPQQRMQYLFLYSWITRITALELHFTLHSIVCMKPRRFSATICWLFVPKNAHNWPIIAYTNSEHGFEMWIRALKVPKTI